MALIDEVKNDIRAQKKIEPDTKTAEEPKKKRHRRTKAEMEAYRQKKMAEEEAKYLKAQQAAPKQEKTKGSVPKAKARAGQVKKPNPALATAVLSPITPLFSLQIPNLPEGDCLVICYGKGMLKTLKGA